MKRVVLLRHAERQNRADNSSHLSQAGIVQSRAAGIGFERFDLVVTSPLPRAVETAIVMGFAVHATHPGIQDIGERILVHVPWDAGFAAWAAAYGSVAEVRAYVDYLASLSFGWLDRVAEGGSLLVVSHGGIVEALALGLNPEADGASLGEAAGYAEGFEAVVEHGQAATLRAIRR